MMQPKPGEDGNYPVDKATAISGEKLLRNIMSDNKIELYATYVSLFGKNRSSPFSDFVLIKNGDYNLLPVHHIVLLMFLVRFPFVNFNFLAG